MGVLDNEKTLAEYNIQKESTLILVIGEHEGMVRFQMAITIQKALTGDKVQLVVANSDTIACVKAKVSRLGIQHKKFCALPNSQRLIYEDMVLDNEKTLAEYNIQKESTLILVIGEPEGMVISIQKPVTNDKVHLSVDHSDTIALVKAKISGLGTRLNEFCVIPDKQRLIYKDIVLANEKTLAEYNIQNESTLQWGIGEPELMETCWIPSARASWMTC